MNHSKNKKVHFVSLGCPKNLVDSEIMLGTLKADGFDVADSPDAADAIVVNTCGFIEDAKKESIEKILEMAENKKTGQLKKLIVAGCLTQRYQDELVAGLPEADLFIGSGQFQNINTILKESFAGNEQKKFFNLPTYLQQSDTPRINSQLKHRAYLKISEGCKKRCSFCAIPLIRGNLQSRTVENIVSEAKLLVAGGVKELIVISHDFTDFGWDLRKQEGRERETCFDLLERLSSESGAEWIRVLYLYPDGVSSEILDLISQRANLVKYFDMPLQHINDEVLKNMNRRMKRSEIEAVLREIRQKIPDAVIRTQFIVGFPGETEEQFEELLTFIEEQKFDRVGCFKYSPEEDTKASAMKSQIDEEIKEERYQRLMALQQEMSREQNAKLVGKIMDVIIEGLSEETDLLLQGRNSQQAPDIDGVTLINDGQASIGDIVRVKITESHDYDLVGQIVN